MTQKSITLDFSKTLSADPSQNMFPEYTGKTPSDDVRTMMEDNIAEVWGHIPQGEQQQKLYDDLSGHTVDNPLKINKPGSPTVEKLVDAKGGILYDPDTNTLVISEANNPYSEKGYTGKDGKPHAFTDFRITIHELFHTVDPNDALREKNATDSANGFPEDKVGKPRDPDHPDVFPFPTDNILTKLLDFLISPAHAAIDPNTSDLFDMSQNWRPPIRPRADPLIFDLDGDGIETTAISDWSSTHFDHNADGQRSGTGWVHPDDALLVMDLNDNGTIDSGRELFGDSTLLNDGSTAADGFEALAELDSNQDGKIDSQDTDFNQLRLWQDKNQDGISQTDELITLEQEGIIAISTASIAQGTFQNGNLITASGEYQKSDGSTADVGNLLFARSDFFTSFADIAIPDSHQNIINLHGSGQVRDLQQAATLSAPLTASLIDYKAASTKADQLALIDTVLQDWADSSDMSSMSEHAKSEGFNVIYTFGNILTPNVSQFESLLTTYESDTHSKLDPENFWQSAMFIEQREDYQKWSNIINVLERFNGREFISFTTPDANANNVVTLSEASGETPASTVELHGQSYIQYTIAQPQLNLLQQSYDTLKNSVYQGLLTQTIFKPLIDSIGLNVVNDALVVDFSAMEALLQQGIANDELAGIDDLINFNHATSTLLREQGWDGWAFLGEQLNTTLNITPETQAKLDAGIISFIGEGGTRTLADSRASEILLGNNNNNTLRGEQGDDDIVGYAGDDRIHGGTGNDTLRGSAGQDTLLGEQGDDTYLYGYGDGADTIIDSEGQNIISFDADITPSNVSLSLNNYSLIIALDSYQDFIQYNAFAPNAYLSGEQASDLKPVEVRFADGTIWDANTLLSLLTLPTADSLVGSPGDDVFVVDTILDTVEEQANQGIDTIELSVSSAFSSFGLPANIENITLTGFLNIDAHGNNLDNILIGNSGHNDLYGREGMDHYFGGQGNDTYHIGSRGEFANIVEYANEGVDSIFYVGGEHASSITLPDNVEHLDVRLVNAYNYALTSHYIGNDLDNAISVRANRHVYNTAPLEDWPRYSLTGNGGNDSLSGTITRDFLSGGSGNDSLYAGGDEDILNGGTGIDFLRGGYGRDTYQLNKGDDNGTEGITTIDDGLDGSLQQITPRPGNIIQFGSGIVKGDIRFEESQGDLIVHYSNEDKVRVVNGVDTTIGAIIDTYQFSDGSVYSYGELLQFSNTNHAPQAFDDELLISGSAITIGQPLQIDSSSILQNDKDIDSDHLTITSVDNAINGMVTLDENGNVLFTPNLDFNGIANFEYEVSDGHGESSRATATITSTIGVEFRINTLTENGYGSPSVTTLSNGNSMVVWPGTSQSSDLQGQIYDNNGLPMGKTFNPDPTLPRFNRYAHSSSPSVTALSDGGAVIVFISTRGSDKPTGIYGQRLNDVGGAIGDVFHISTIDPIAYRNNFTRPENSDPFVPGLGYVDSDPEHSNGGSFARPTVTSTDNGFIVVWEDDHMGQHAHNGIYSRQYDNSGLATTPYSILVNEADVAVDSYWNSSVTTLTDNSYIVAWTSEEFSTSYKSVIYGQRFSELGTKLGDQYRLMDAQNSSISELSDGGFIVVGSENYRSNIIAQRFDQNGEEVGEQLNLSSDSGHISDPPAVLSLSDGSFIITWSEFDADSIDETHLYGQHYDLSGQVIQSKFQISSTEKSALIEKENNYSLSLTESAEGEVFVVWQNWEQGLGIDLRGKRVTLDALDINNHAPELGQALVDQNINENSVLNFTLPANTFTDSDAGDSLNLSATLADGSALPTWLNFDTASQTFSGTPDNDQVGILDIKVTATDTAGLNVSDSFALTINNINDAPIVNGTLNNQTSDEDSLFTYQLPVNTFTDIDVGDSLTLTATLADSSVLPNWLSFDSNSQTLSGTAPLDASGEYTVKVTATDNGGLTVDASFALTINDINPDIVGGAGNETLTGTDHADIINSGEGDDVLIGGEGNDTLIAGKGSDWLQGGQGDDTLVISDDASWSNRFIAYNAGSPGKRGTRERVSITAMQRSHDLFDGGEGFDTAKGSEGNDAIFLHDTFSPLPNGTGPRVKNIERFNMGAGDDIVDLTSPTYDYADVELNGEAGNDVLWGSAGNDTLNGGAGDDKLSGGAGNDTYLFGTGDGHDQIRNYAPDSATSTDTLEFGQGIEADDLWFERAVNDLKITVYNSGDDITIKNWYANDSHQLDKIQLNDGQALMNNQLDQLVQAMAIFNAPSAGTTELMGQIKDEIAPVIAASWG